MGPRGQNRIQVFDAALVFTVALALRVIHVLAMRQSPYFDHPLVDAYTFHEAARSIAAGDGHPDRIFWQPPGYPYFLGLTYWVAGGVNFLAPRLLQAVLGAAAAVLTAWIGARPFGRGVGLAAGLAVALYGILIYFDGELLGVSLTVALQLGAVALATLALDRGRAWVWLVTGTLGGLASLVTATSLVLVATFAFFARRLAPWCLLGAALAIAPATIRNIVRGGELVPISWNAGVNLYVGNNPRYDEVVAVRPDIRWKDLTAEPERHGIWTKTGASNYFVAKVVDWAREDPLDFLRLQLRKARLLLGGDEIFRNQAIYPSRAYSPVLFLFLWKVPGVAFPFGVLAPLSLLGLVVAWKRAPLLAWIVVVYALANVAFFITARYRAPLIPYLAIFAAEGVRWFLVDAKRTARAVAAAGVVLVYAFSNLGAGPMPSRMNADAELVLAQFLHRDGRLEEADRHYRISLEGNPNDPETWADLGALQLDQGAFDVAERSFARSLSIHPEESPALVGLAALREREGRLPEALDLYERAAHADPKDPWPRVRIRELNRALGHVSQRK